MILVSLGGARSRSRDARVVADMAQLRSMAEIIYSDDGSYENLSCQYEGTRRKDMELLCDDIEQQTGHKPIFHQSKEEYCAYTRINSPGLYFCIDSTGAALPTYISGEANYCTGTTFRCPKEKGTPPSSLPSDWTKFTPKPRLFYERTKVIILGPIVIGLISGLFISILAYFKRKKEKDLKQVMGWILIWEGRITPICSGILVIYATIAITFLILFNYSGIIASILIMFGFFLYGLVIGFGIGSFFHRITTVGVILLIFVLLPGLAMIFLALSRAR